jgi:WD40 repeat protein
MEAWFAQNRRKVWMSTRSDRVWPRSPIQLYHWFRSIDQPLQLALALLAAVVLALGSVRIYTCLTAWPVRLELRSPSGITCVLACTSDGKTLATESGGITLWDTETGKVRRQLSAADDFRESLGTFAPDGKLLAVAGQVESFRSGMPNPNPITIRIFDVQSGRLVAEVVTTDSDIDNLSFLENGRGVRAVLSSYWRCWKVVTWDAHNGAVISTQPLVLPSPPFTEAVLSHDGQTLAIASGEPDVTLWEPTNGRVRCVLKRDVPLRTPYGRISFSMDDAMLAIGRDDGSVEIWDLVTRQVRKILRRYAAEYDAGHVEFSPDGRMLVSTGGVKSVLGLRLMRARMEGLFHKPQSGVVDLVVWDIASGRRLTRVEDEFHRLISPDGRMLVTSSLYGDNAIRIRTIPRVNR